MERSYYAGLSYEKTGYAAPKKPFTITSIATSGDLETVTLIWNSRPGFFYTVLSGSDLLAIDQQVDEPVESQGEETKATFANPYAGDATGGFFRVSEMLPPEIFQEDFESGLNGWVATDFSENGTVWEHGKPSNGPTEAYSGVNVFGTGLAADYADNTDISLLSPVIDLAGVDRARLEFYSFRDIESPFEGHVTDSAAIYITDETGEEYLTQLPIWTRGGSSLQWRKERVAIPAEGLDRKIRFEFHFYSDARNDDGPHAGWFIDNIIIPSN